MSKVAVFLAASLPALAATVGTAALAHPDAGPKDLSEVVVTGAPYAVSIGSTLTGVDVIKREELDQAAAAGLGDVLAGVPGVRSSFFGPGASRPVIRGLAGPRVMVLTNGVGLIDASGLSPDHQVASDPQEAERIEVLRGPSALAYGGSAIGGVVNIIDDRIPSAYAAGLHGRALATASSVDEGHAVSTALAAGVGGRWSLTLDGVRRSAGAYEASGATVPNTYVDLSAYGGGVSYVGGEGWGGLALKRTETEYGSAAEETVHIELQQTRVDTRGGWDVSLGPFDTLKFAGGWAKYRHAEYDGAELGTTFLSDGYEGRLELVQRERDGWQGAVGVQGLRRDFDAIGEEAMIPRTRITEAGVFALQRLDQDRWGLEGGVRLDRRRLDSVAATRDFTNLSASAGAFLRPAPGWFLGLSVSRTSRAPTEEELFSEGPHPATGQFEIGDAGLGREVSNAIEATAHYGAGRWVLDAHVFHVRYESYIDQFATGTTDPDSGFPVFHFAQGGARFHGLEAEGSYEVWRDGARSLRLEVVGDYVRGSTARGPAPRIPPWSATVRGVFEARTLSGTFEVRHVAAQDRVAVFETPTDDYTLVDVSVEARPFADRPDLKLFLDVRNLGDVEAREHASFLKDVAPLPGRNLRLGVAYRF